jgi:hypothetical protein
VNLFYWDLDCNGAIVLHLLDANCSVRPLSQGDVIGIIKIESEDGFQKKSKWLISIDREQSGSFHEEISEEYNRKDIFLSNIPHGEFYLLQYENFEEPAVGEFIDGKLIIKIFDFGEPIDFSVSLCEESLPDIFLNVTENEGIYTTHSISLENDLLKDVLVKRWVKQVRLVASANNKLVIYYEMRSEIQASSDIKRDSINVDEYEKTIKKSFIVTVVSGFVSGPRISASDVFYSRVRIDFNPEWMLGTSGGNEIIFTSSTEGVVRYIDIFENKHSSSRHFTWCQRDDGSVMLSIFNFGDILIKFIKAVSGGYQALMIYSDKDNLHWRCPQVHYWLVDNDPSVTHKDFPGHYRFTSDNGWAQIDIILHKDGTVTSVPEWLVGGHWFQDANGDIVSYEYIDAGGSASANYDECYASFNCLSKDSFSHIRRLRILNKENNIFNLKYDAALYGARFGIAGDNYYTVAWTYTWTRVGDAPEKL